MFYCELWGAKILSPKMVDFVEMEDHLFPVMKHMGWLRMAFFFWGGGLFADGGKAEIPFTLTSIYSFPSE